VIRLVLAQDTLTFVNAAVDAKVAPPPTQYHARWFTFDNATGETSPIGETASPAPRVVAPGSLPAAVGSFVQVDISAEGGPAAWQQPVHAWFKRTDDGWKSVGLTRIP
jgi:hypothetical protein